MGFLTNVFSSFFYFMFESVGPEALQGHDLVRKDIFLERKRLVNPGNSSKFGSDQSSSRKRDMRTESFRLVEQRWSVV